MEIILNFASEVKNSNHPNLDWLHSLMVENNIMFNALLFNESPPDRENSLSRLETICRQSGGIYESVSSVDSTIQNLKKHEDQYYELAFITNRRIEEKNVRIMTVNPEEQLFYKRKYSGSEIAAIMTSIPQSKIDIKNIRVTRNKISFQLESYKKKDNQGFGLIRVRVELSTPEDHSVFQTENTLRATQDKTQVTIQIPDYKNGPLFLTITATDLISSLTRQVTHQVASRRHLPINPARGEFN
jgi:hypothetical protein